MIGTVLSKGWSIVQMLQRPVLIIEVSPGEVQAFLCDNFKPKGRDFFQNEVIGGQDITGLLSRIEMNQAANNKYSFEIAIEGIPYIDFSFGHDNFILLKSIR